MKEQGNSIPARIAELKMLIANKERDLEASKKRDKELTGELEGRQKKAMELRAHESALAKEHGKAKDEFEVLNKNRGPTE